MDESRKYMKLFFDLEFTGLNQNTTPISLGIISENNIKFYAEFNDYDKEQCDEWIYHNVIGNLRLKDNYFEIDGKNNLTIKSNIKEIREKLIQWLEKNFNHHRHILFVGDCCSYDWVLLQKILGGAFNMPKNIHYSPLEVDTLLINKGFKINIQRERIANNNTRQKHNALNDAIQTKEVYEIITGNETK